MSRAAVLVAAAPFGAVVAVTGLLVHRSAWRVGGTGLPWGLGLALIGAFAAVVAAAAVAGLVASALVAGGWVASVLLVLPGRPEGDFLLAADGSGQAFTWGGLLTLAVAFVVGVRAAPPPRR